VNFASPYLAYLSISSQPLVTVTKAAQATDAAAGTGAVSDAVTGTFTGFTASSIECLDFGLCVPTIKFEPGLDGRKANDVAKTACTVALAALGGKVAQTADDWNTQLEFAGTNLNLDNAPEARLVGYD
jgi:hypothetical protein